MNLKVIRNNSLFKFISLCCILVAYFFYINYKFDAVTGVVSTFLTWSFFVLCTPIADAGFLLDFPIRLIFKIRMLFTEMIVWVIAIMANLIIFNFYSSYYSKTILTSLFYSILSNPYPYWSIIILSFIGTFLSIHFGDEVLDNITHKKHSATIKGIHSTVFIAALIILTIILYYELLSKLNINLT